nr:MAG TPA: hypothetical protein [Microviridae sp.]
MVQLVTLLSNYQAALFGCLLRFLLKSFTLT